MKLSKLFNKKEFVITGEVGPPKGTHMSEMLKEARFLRPCVDAINVTDNQSAVMRLGSLVVSAKIKEQGVEPIYQLTCRDRNRIAIQSDLLSASAMGIENVLCLTGDHIQLGDHFDAKAVFDLDSVQLINVVRGLNEGHDMMGNELAGKTDFYIGAVVNPGADPLELQVIKMEKKIEAGAQFFQTQAVYDVSLFEKFIRMVEGFNVPIMVGIIPLKSPGMARYMNQNVSGIQVPESMIKEIGSVDSNSRKKKSLEMTIKLINELKDMCQGVHIMPLGWWDLIPYIVKEFKEESKCYEETRKAIAS